MGLKAFISAWVLSALSLSVQAQVETAPAPSSQPTTSTQPTTAPAGSNFAANCTALMSKSWPDAAWMGARIAFNIVLWAALFLLMGIVGGIVLWLLARRWKLLDASWSWYRYVRWAWVLVFLVSVAAGCCYAGGWLGLQRELTTAIEDDRVIDKVCGHVIVAAALDDAQYRATGQESVQEMVRVVQAGEATRALSLNDIGQAFGQDVLAKDPRFDNWLGRLLLTLKIGDELEELTGVDSGALVAIACSAELGQQLGGNADAKKGALLFALVMKKIRDKAADGVRDAIRPHILTGVIAGVLIPFALVAVLRLAVRFIRPRVTVPA